MTNVIKKHSISSELAQKMVNAAVKKANELGVSENVVILDDGGNLKAFSRMDGAPILCIEMRKTRRTRLCLASPLRTFSTLSTRPVPLGRHPHAFACGGVGRRVSH